MDKFTTLNNLYKIANKLDEAGYTSEADIVSNVMIKISNVFDNDYRTPGRSEMFEEDLPGEIPDLEIKEETLETLKNYLSTIMPEADDQKLTDMAIDFLETMEARARRLKIDSVTDDEF
jgi:hypothetical protein